MASTYPGGIFDGLAKFYVSVAIVWTAALLVGASFLVINRHEQCVRIRNLPLALCAVACLHVYWILCMSAYSMGSAYPCSVEYWIMSIYLPLGIALFQANSMQLLSVFGIQEKLLYTAHQPHRAQFSARPRSPRRYLFQWREMNLVQRTELGIAVGMVVQVRILNSAVDGRALTDPQNQLCLSLAVYLSSRKFNTFGTFSHPGSPEEIPSILWQLFWSWIFAPYILWKIRHIQDIHHWRRQITCCVIAALPGSPMWFVALHSPTDPWDAINRYWVPSLWFAPGILAMEAVTIFFPCYELVVARRQRHRILEAMEAWNEKQKGDTDESRSGTSRSHSDTSRMHELYCLKALENYLADDSSALLQFAAAKEFSGENIIFLNYVRDWKAAWASLQASKPEYDWNRDPQYHRLDFFKIAVEIYTTCVDLKTAEFPINIESRVYTDLMDLFGDAVELMGQCVSKDAGTRMDEDTRALCLDEHVYEGQGIMHVKPRLPDSIVVPDGFNICAFDEAQKSIISLVFTNTWPKFIDSSNDMSIKI
ncbi:uncharacterized protein BDW43DRAFT_315374 [Aspergillus alliaceus]|uniref:uncharacterized protein n=1 Tax=Petromyces alliaceus TaxID=209559 RepID=UPI0012A3EBE1|nr:uncharacterized protein BDW43DRAFT_315374 [Aspergillus alliaceus]KAB8229038.1 hypothetical protein BDW43DRAFT_315374 [Aspergillus alliaceus]